jgi:DNA replication protein DnaC
MHEKRMRKNVMGSGIDGEYRGYTLETWDQELTAEQRDGKVLARAAAEKVLEHRGARWEAKGFWAAGVVFAGVYGTGKTGMMAAIANGLALQGQRILWINMSRLWTTLRGTFERDPDKKPDVPEWKLMKEIGDADVLFLDDVNWSQDGVSDQATPAAVRFFTDIVRVRHDFGKPYFLTTNHVTMESFQAEWKARACTVIFQDCHWVEMGGAVLRVKSKVWAG